MGVNRVLKRKWEQASSDTGEANCELFDISAELSKQLQRTVKMGSIFKVTKMSMTIDDGENHPINPDPSVAQIKGRIRFFQPTYGRIQAIKQARKTLVSHMTSEGIDYRKNKFWDFRFTPRAYSNYRNLDIHNIATLNGNDALALVQNGGQGTEIFTSYNSSVQPSEQVTSADFSTGLETRLDNSAGSTDFVLHEGTIHEGNWRLAYTGFEEMSIELLWDVQAGVYTWEYDPSPQQYLSILAGLVEFVIDEEYVAPSPNNLEFHWNIECSGWKSIYSPRKRKSRGRKRKSKK